MSNDNGTPDLVKHLRNHREILNDPGLFLGKGRAITALFVHQLAEEATRVLNGYLECFEDEDLEQFRRYSRNRRSWPVLKTEHRTDRDRQDRLFREILQVGQDSVIDVSRSSRWKADKPINIAAVNLVTLLCELRAQVRFGVVDEADLKHNEWVSSKLPELDSDTATAWFHMMWLFLLEYTYGNPMKKGKAPHPRLGVCVADAAKDKKGVGDEKTKLSNFKDSLRRKLWEAFVSVLNYRIKSYLKLNGVPSLKEGHDEVLRLTGVPPK